MHVDIVSIAMLKKEPEKTRLDIFEFLRKLVKEWGRHLEEQTASGTDPSQVRLNLTLYKQSKESLHGFLKLLKKGQLQPDILDNITKITHHMQSREYVSANDAYLRLAIGNAPWPIGITGVSIHERSAHERISTSQTARTSVLLSFSSKCVRCSER